MSAIDIEQVIVPDSALLGILKGLYDFNADTFMASFYTSTAAFTNATTAYTATNEVAGAGYAAGGVTLTRVAPTAANGVGLTGWVDHTTAAITIADIKWIMVYDSTVANAAIYIMKLKTSIAKTAATMVIRFPQPAAGFAPIKLVVSSG